MFLFARIVLGSVQNLDDVEEIREELRCLPETLDEAQVILPIVGSFLLLIFRSYGRILRRINCLKPEVVRDRTSKGFGLDWVYTHASDYLRDSTSPYCCTT